MSDLLGVLIAGAFVLYGLAYLVVLYVEEIRRPRRPFLVGRLYDRNEKPGPYRNGDVPVADLRRLVTPSRTDRQPRDSASETKGGKGAVEVFDKRTGDC